jgi:hypothetical protein
MRDEQTTLAACTVTLSAAFVARFLAAAIVFLVTMHVCVYIVKFAVGHDHLMGLTPLFDLDRENNLPTWYSGTVFIATAAALGVIAAAKHQAGDRFAVHWTVLTVIFMYLSFDELTRMHERWGTALPDSFKAFRQQAVLGGVFGRLWTLPAWVLAIVVGVSYFRFLLHLPHRTRTLFLVSGTAFLSGAFGMEMIDASYLAAGGQDPRLRFVFVTLEEGLEMASIALFLCAVIRYGSKRVGRVQLAFGD